MKLLFIGNSATYVHDIPGMLARLAAAEGYAVEVTTHAKGGFELAGHADTESEAGRAARQAIAAGYDAVFLQDNGNCIASPEKRTACMAACQSLDAAIRASGARTYLYVRPPYGKEHAGRDAFAQCVAFDELFRSIAKLLECQSAWANRAYAYAMRHTELPLWGPDHAHTSEYGAYLIACVFFGTLFGRSTTGLPADKIPEDAAHTLQQIADRIVLEQQIPW